MGNQLKVREVSFHRRQRHGLAKMKDKLAKEIEDSIEVLVELQKSKDEKIRGQAAKDILNFYQDAVKIIELDIMQRIIAGKRFGGNGGNLEVDDNSPLLDFDTVVEPD